MPMLKQIELEYKMGLSQKVDFSHWLLYFFENLSKRTDHKELT